MSHRMPSLSQSSLLSDRVKPKNQTANSARNKGKGKEPAVPDAPKSAAVRALETTLKKLQSEPGDHKDAKGGCFCLARTHELSPYCPICSCCGLVLCTLNAPYYACPHCSVSLLSPSAKQILLDRLRTDLASTIAKEEEEAEHVREEAREAAGAFPSLSGTLGQQQQAAQQRPHKVLSLNSKTKRVTVASYTSAPATISSARLEAQEREVSPERVRAPSQEIPIARELPHFSRPWIDMRGDGFARTLTYVRDPRADKDRLKEERKARKAGKRRGSGEDAVGQSGPSVEPET